MCMDRSRERPTATLNRKAFFSTSVALTSGATDEGLFVCCPTGHSVRRSVGLPPTPTISILGVALGASACRAAVPPRRRPRRRGRGRAAAAVRRFRRTCANTHDATMRVAARGAPDRGRPPSWPSGRPLCARRSCQMGRGAADATTATAGGAAATGCPYARTHAASTGRTRRRGRGPSAATVEVKSASTQSRRHAVRTGGRSQRQRRHGRPDGAPPLAVVAAPAGRPPPRPLRTTADATEAGQKRSRGFGIRPHAHAIRRGGDGGGGNGGRTRLLGRHQRGEKASHPPRRTAFAAAVRQAVVASVPPPSPRPRSSTTKDATTAAFAATAAITAAAAAAAAARRRMRVRVARMVVVRPSPGWRQARRQRRQLRRPPIPPGARGCAARGTQNSAVRNRKKWARGLAHGARPVGARTSSQSWNQPTNGRFVLYFVLCRSQNTGSFVCVHVLIHLLVSFRAPLNRFQADEGILGRQGTGLAGWRMLATRIDRLIFRFRQTGPSLLLYHAWFDTQYC